MLKDERPDGKIEYSFSRLDLANILMKHVEEGLAMAGKPTHAPYTAYVFVDESTGQTEHGAIRIVVSPEKA